MNYSIVFTSKADNDLEDAIKWYEKKKTFLGWEFREEVSRAIDKIVDDRIEYQAYSGDIKRLKLQRFPFNIFYLKDLSNRQITILALFHFKRKPEEINSRL